MKSPIDKCVELNSKQSCGIWDTWVDGHDDEPTEEDKWRRKIKKKKKKKKKKKSISDLCQNKITKTYKIVVSNGTRA